MLSQSEYRRIRIARAVEAGICHKCGKPLDDDKQTCKACRVRHYRLYGNYKGIPMKEHKKKNPKISLDQMSKIAREMGISYGELVYKIESGKLDQMALTTPSGDPLP